MKYLLTDQETERLKFRKLEISDFEVWKELFADADTRDLLGMSEFETPEKCCKKWFEWTFHRYDNNLGGQNILIEKASGEIVGQAGLLIREIDGVEELEIAYSILPKFRRKGFAAEASKKCQDFAFENNFKERLVSLIVPENINSKRTALKNGLRFKEQINFHNQLFDVYEITKDDWLHQKN